MLNRWPTIHGQCRRTWRTSGTKCTRKIGRKVCNGLGTWWNGENFALNKKIIIILRHPNCLQCLPKPAVFELALCVPGTNFVSNALWASIAIRWTNSKSTLGWSKKFVECFCCFLSLFFLQQDGVFKVMLEMECQHAAKELDSEEFFENSVESKFIFFYLNFLFYF